MPDTGNIFPIFRSCNTAFKQRPEERRRQWCCDCPKCRFVFLALAPFVAKPDLIGIFGANLLDDPSQIDGFAALCGWRGHKPFECVGETAECAAVMAELGRRPDWRDDAVVRRLNDRCAVRKPDRKRTGHCSRRARRIGSPTGIWRSSMRAADLGGKRVAVWGLAREGRAAIRFIRARHPLLPVTGARRRSSDAAPGRSWRRHRLRLRFRAHRRRPRRVEAIVKSPGVSLYRDEIRAARDKGATITSLLNLWFAEQYALTTICVTGTKGKSTTASLIAHMLRGLGRRVALAGNIGVPITEIDPDAVDYAVIELSSYQVADFTGACDIAVLTSLFPEHLDWHRSVDNYYRDKVNLLAHGRRAIVDREAAARVGAILGDRAPPTDLFNDANRLHARDGVIFDGPVRIGVVQNAYLARPHNLANLCAALTVVKWLGLDPAAALGSVRDFEGLPHRQQELGVVGGVLYVNDSISTVPEATLAALSVYAGRDITLILGGYDRGVDYGALIGRIVAGAARNVICLGAGGRRICDQMRAELARAPDAACALYRVRSMAEAVSHGKTGDAAGGVVLLSPAAPSYGDYRDFTERGRDFAGHVGFRDNGG